MHEIKNREHKKTEKFMKKSMVTAVALAACVSTQLFAQKAKQDIITFALTADGQASVSTTTGNNVGTWSAEPEHYKTTGKKQLTQVNILRAIALALHGNAGWYTSKAKLVLVQGELSGFFNITPDLANSSANSSDSYPLSGSFSSDDGDSSTVLSGSTDSTYVQLATGRSMTNNPINGELPVGHMQPWGQIFVQDPGQPDYSLTDPYCENVTYFFALTVQECYDCFYLNSFISDATFRQQSGTKSGPPCCGVSTTLLGSGKDQYYLTLSFDNTQNNPYLNPDNENYYVGVTGVAPTVGRLDGVEPDSLPYDDVISSGLGKPSPYEMRFTLNGIFTYTWTLKFVNASDLLPDFVGTGNYSANGYGFIGLVCSLLSGSASIAETLVNQNDCCLDQPWSDWWYGPGNDTLAGGTGYYDNDPTQSPLNAPPSLSFHENFNVVYAYQGNPYPAIDFNGTVPVYP